MAKFAGFGLCLWYMCVHVKCVREKAGMHLCIFVHSHVCKRESMCVLCVCGTCVCYGGDASEIWHCAKHLLSSWCM